MIKKTLLAVACLTSISCFADEIEDQINLGLDAYRNGDYQVALDELKYSIASIQEKLNDENALLMPDAPEGWTASDVDNQSAGMAMLGGGTHMSRSYEQGDKSVQLTLLTGAMASSLTMLTNPMVINNNPDMKPYRYQRYKGVIEQPEGQVKIILSVAGQIMVQLEGNGVTQEELEQFLKLMDFAKIQAALLQ